MRHTYGQNDSSANANRLSNSIPVSYTLYKDGANYYGECNVPGGNDITPGTVFSTVLQNAIDALPNGGVIYIKAGTYVVSTKISLKNDVALVGEGTATILETDSATIDVLEADNQYDWELHNFLMRSSVTRTAGSYIHYTNGSATGIHHNVVSDIWMEAPYNGVVLEGDSRWSWWTRIRIHNPVAYGFVINNAQMVFIDGLYTYSTSPATYTAGLHIQNMMSLYMRNCEIMATPTYGVVCDPSTGVIVSFLKIYNCACDGASDAGWVFDAVANGGAIRGVWLTDCWGGACTNYGLRIAGAEDTQVVGGQYALNGKEGIIVQDASLGTLINGSQVASNSQTTDNTYDGIKVEAGTDDFQIQNCDCSSNRFGYTAKQQKYGIEVATGDSDHYIILGNLCRNNQTGGVQDDGTGVNKEVDHNQT